MPAIASLIASVRIVVRTGVAKARRPADQHLVEPGHRAGPRATGSPKLRRSASGVNSPLRGRCPVSLPLIGGSRIRPSALT